MKTFKNLLLEIHWVYFNLIVYKASVGKRNQVSFNQEPCPPRGYTCNSKWKEIVKILWWILMSFFSRTTWLISNNYGIKNSCVKGFKFILMGLWGFSFKRMKKHPYKTNCYEFFSLSKHAGRVIALVMLVYCKESDVAHGSLNIFII